MKTQVETYEIEEINGSEASTMAADAAAIELIERLGLTGQKKLVNTETAERCAFRRMTLLEKAVFETLFPEKTKLEDFATEIIPLRVLEIAEKAKNDSRFVQLKVWHSLTMQDPVLVGIAGTLKEETWGEYISGEQIFLLARWGEALLPLETLAKQAKEIWKAKRRKDLNEKLEDAKRKLNSIADDADVAFTTGEMPI